VATVHRRPVPNHSDRVGGDAAWRRAPARAVRTLYLATPLFALADLLLGLNLRTAFLDATPPLKWGYYVGATAAGVLTWRWPRLTAAVGLAESSLNIALTALAVGLAYTRLTDLADARVTSPFNAESIAGLLLSTGVLTLSYVTSKAALSRASRDHA
jgi:hypothetical protein